MIYKHRSTTPNWLYQHPSLDANTLPKIKNELLQLFDTLKAGWSNPVTTISRWTPLSNENIKNICPSLLQELDRLGLQKNLIGVAFISLVDDQQFGVHVDNNDDVSLNIPLLNCSGTYTVWYDCQFVKNIKKWANDDLIDKLHTLTEINRVEADLPYWINVNVLHQPVATHKNFRLAAGLRFDPQPLDQHGQLWPHLVRK